MIKLTICTIALIISSCSSSPKASNSNTEDSMVENVTQDESGDSRTPISNGKSPTAPEASQVPKEIQKATANALDEAIRSQSDEKILKATAQALLQNPSDVKALNALALFNYKKGRLVAAKYLLLKAIQVQGTSETYNNLGIVHLALNDKREALLAFRQAFTLNPQDGVTAANLGAIFVAQKDFNKAIVALETAYQKGFRDFRVLNNYALALTATGKGSQAQAIYEKALKEQSNNKDILLNHAILLIEVLNKYKEGSEVLNRLKFVGGSSEQRSRIKDLEYKVKIGLQ